MRWGNTLSMCMYGPNYPLLTPSHGMTHTAPNYDIASNDRILILSGAEQVRSCALHIFRLGKKSFLSTPGYRQYVLRTEETLVTLSP